MFECIIFESILFESILFESNLLESIKGMSKICFAEVECWMIVLGKLIPYLTPTVPDSRKAVDHITRYMYSIKNLNFRTFDFLTL
jgi:hypothetical protein